MKAIIETGGKQYLVEEGTEIYIELLDQEAGSKERSGHERAAGDVPAAV